MVRDPPTQTPPLPNFADLAALQRAILQFITEWNEIAHPFRWTTASFEKILAKVDAALATEATAPRRRRLTGRDLRGAVLRSPDGTEETRIVYDTATSELWIDREKTSLDPEPSRERRGAPIQLAADGTLGLRVFVDGSVVEVFVADGTCLTSRVYPIRADSVGVGLGVRGGHARVQIVNAWEIRTIWPVASRSIPEVRA